MLRIDGFWKQCPDYPDFVCSMAGKVERKDGKEFELFKIASDQGPNRYYWSLQNHWRGHVHRQVFRAWGPPNPDPKRYTCIDHKDNNSLNNEISNLHWSCSSLNALNVDSDRFKGWTYRKGRSSPYATQIKWLGKTWQIGRYKTPEKAHARYLDCKDWLQKAYREHRWCDDALILVYRCFGHLNNWKSGLDTPEAKHARTHGNRIMAEMEFASVKWEELQKLKKLAKLQRLGLNILTAEKTSKD